MHSVYSTIAMECFHGRPAASSRTVRGTFGFVAKRRVASSFDMTKTVICLREQWMPVKIVVPIIPFAQHIRD
jgi:hypothetical protein